jgi:hypothetical protein
MLNCGDSNKYAQPINRKISMKELQSLKILIRKDSYEWSDLSSTKRKEFSIFFTC